MRTVTPRRLSEGLTSGDHASLDTVVVEGTFALTLDPTKAEAVAALLVRLQDRDLAAVRPVLSAPGNTTRTGRVVADLLAAEEHDRRLRDRVLSPLVPLAARGEDLPAGVLLRLWRALQADAPGETRAAAAAADDLTDPLRARRAADALTALAVQRFDGAGAWAQLRDTLDGQRAGAAKALRSYLALCPLARAVTPRLEAWLRTASPEHASAVRLAYRDAASIADDAPPLLLRMLGAGLDPPSQMLRLVAAVMDRPKDSFLAISELGPLAEAVLDGVEADIQAVRAFDAMGGAEAGRRAAAAACQGVRALAEFDRSIDVQPNGPWAARLAAQRRNLARGVEARLRLTDPTLARALPVHAPRPGSPLRGAPKLDAPVDPAARVKGEAAMAFLSGVRAVADGGGFAVQRAKAVEAVDLRLSSYADDLLQALHDGDPSETEEAKARLAFVADALAQVRDARAGEVLRRRVAAA